MPSSPDHGPTACQRRWRKRQRTGAMVLQVEIEDPIALADALVTSGWLHPRDVEDRGKLNEAFAAMVSEITQSRKRY